VAIINLGLNQLTIISFVVTGIKEKQTVLIILIGH